MPTFDDDYEPLDPAERCDALYGPYHIGLCAPGLSELALVFDARWIPTPEPPARICDLRERSLEQLDGAVRRWGWYASADRTRDHMHAELDAELADLQAFDFPEDDALYVAVVELLTRAPPRSRAPGEISSHTRALPMSVVPASYEAYSRPCLLTHEPLTAGLVRRGYRRL